jgi:RES domain
LSEAVWDETWFTTSTRQRQVQAWRGVEAQHIVATMRLVDSLDEQALLETLLERSKPPLPAAAPKASKGPRASKAAQAAPAAMAPPHYLLTTPFRYRPQHGSRFRRAGTLGVWYGAETLQTACAEVGYWRWRFLMDSAGLQNQELLTEHSFFQAQIEGQAIDLTAKPWRAARKHWMAPMNYNPTQALADAARTRGVQWLRYASVRQAGGHCAVVLDVAALTAIHLPSQQTWHCRTTCTGVRWVHGDERYEWQLGAAG